MAKTPPPKRPSQGRAGQGKAGQGRGGGGGFNDMLQQVQQMQAGMAAAQDALADETVEASVGGGMVKAVVTGTGELKSISIAPEVVDPDDVEMLEDLVLAAVTEGLRMAQDLAAQKMGGLTAGLDLGALGGPGGLGGLLG